MHSECGYSYLGPNSLYGLTYPEMRMLYRGHEVAKEQAEKEYDTDRGMTDGDDEAFAEFADDVNSSQPTAA